jgi:hypothetical protein
MAMPQSTQPFEFNIAPLMKMYTDSIEAWKKNYESLAMNAKAAQSPYTATEAQSPYDAAIATWQKSGEELFKRFSEQQIEMYRFFVAQWEQFLKLPAQLAQCRTPAEAGQVQAAFLSQFATDYVQETQKLSQPIGELMSHWTALQNH